MPSRFATLRVLAALAAQAPSAESRSPSFPACGRGHDDPGWVIL